MLRTTAYNEPNGHALRPRVTQCGQEMRFSSVPVGPINTGAAVLLDEVAVEQPQDGRLGDAAVEVELILGQRLLLGEPRSRAWH